MKGPLLILSAFLAISGWSHQVYNPEQTLSWSAHKGSAKAQYQLANHYWKEKKRTAAHYWWQRSARQKYSPAIESLINAFPKANEDWLKLAVAAGNPSAKRQVAMAELTNDNISIEQWRRRWQSADEPWLNQQLALLERYQKNKSCAMSIKVIAANQSSKKRYLDFLSAVKNAPFTTSNWCVSWVLDENLSCTTGDERDRASCRSEKKSDRTVILADKGIASADSRTLTLTPDSSEKVIQHELGHWLGFADEYAMSESLAQKFCNGHYEHESLNIIVSGHAQYYSSEQVQDIYNNLPWKNEISSWQEIAQKDGDKWRLGSQESREIGLFKADTCNAISGKQAWRPVNVRTAMEQHNTGLWPELYLKLLGEYQ